MKFSIELEDDIKDFNAPVTVTRRNGDVIEGVYKMLLADVITCLTNAAKEFSEINDETPFLPTNCIKFVWKNKERTTCDVYIEVSKHQRDIKYFENNITNVGFPRMIFKYRVHMKGVKLVSVIALKEHDPIRLTTPIYHFPYPHVSTDGNVCMGGNTFPKIERVQQTETLHNLFLDSPFSNDYGAKSAKGVTANVLFDMMANTPFNDELLLPNTNHVYNSTNRKHETKHLTLEDFFKFEMA